MKPKLLDLFCGAGGAGVGLDRAGFEVVGVDIEPQSRYPFEFHQADALEFPLEDYDAYWASPPCQAYSEATPIAAKSNHPKLIPVVRALLEATNKPYIIENVAGSRRDLINPVMLCGSMFGLGVWRHRYFELYPFWVLSPRTCLHERRPMVVVGAGSNVRKGRRQTEVMTPVLVTGTTSRKDDMDLEYSTAACKQAMGIDWMTRKELDQAIPPAYSEFLGRELLRVI